MSQLCGGKSSDKQPDAEISDLVKDNNDAILKAAGVSSGTIVVKSYRTQVVAGLNYFVKVSVDDKDYELRFFRSLQSQTPDFQSATAL